jgi:hypothetical protein
MSTPLTDKEQAYARARAAGKGPAAAYRASRDTSAMAPSTITANAKRYERKPAVKARIEELRRQESRESEESLPSEEPMAPSGLTPKREHFCWLYVEKSNASEAYRLSHDVGPGTKPETVHRKAAELLANGKVTARIEEIRAELRRRAEIKLDDLVEALRPIAFSDIRKICDWGPAIPLRDPATGEVVVVQDVIVKARADLDDAAAAMISKVIRGKDGSIRVELHDKLAAVEKIAKLLGLMKDQHDVNLRDVTPPRPRDPGRDVIVQSVRAFLTAADEYEARIAADEAERKGG